MARSDRVWPPGLNDLASTQEIDNYFDFAKTSMHMRWRMVVRVAKKPYAIEGLRAHGLV